MVKNVLHVLMLSKNAKYQSWRQGGKGDVRGKTWALNAERIMNLILHDKLVFTVNLSTKIVMNRLLD